MDPEPGPPLVIYRPAVPTDAGRLADVHVRTLMLTYRGIDPQEWLDSLPAQLVEREARWRDRLTNFPQEPVFVAEVAPVGVVGFIVGGAARKPSYGYDGELISLYLLPEHQHRGIGRELVRRLVRELVRAGFERVLVRVLTANPARHFYEHLGAYSIGVTHVTVGGEELEESLYGWPDPVGTFGAMGVSPGSP
ncbi:MAG: N-acetyltransferase family protein [Thermoplasmata archaeon]